MNSENLEFALNHLAEEVKKINGQHDYTIKAIESLVEINQNLLKSVQQSKLNQTISVDTSRLEHNIALKLAEIQGFLISQPRSNHYSKSYFLYPEGEGMNTFIYQAAKYLSIIVASIILYFSIKFIVLSIVENSQNAKYRIAIQYIYAGGNAKMREYLEEIVTDLQSDSIQVVYQKKIDRCPAKLK